MKYTKSDLESIVYTQLENLNAQKEHIDLIRQQNELLLKHNHKLINEISNKSKKGLPYPVHKRQKK